MNIDINKIQGGALGNTANTKSASGDKPKATGGTGRNAPIGDDRVSLTTAANVLSSLEQRVNESQGIDLEKVEAVKDALKNGNYPFNPDKIAENMLNMERLLVR